MQAILQSKGIAYALDMVGGEGKYQKRTIATLILIHIFRGFWLMYYPFLTQSPVFLCKDPNDPSITYECTETTGGCTDQNVIEGRTSSLAIDLGLYCEYAYVRTLGSTLFFVGGNIGAGYYAYLSDAKGRKTALQYGYLLGSISYLLLATIASGPITYMLCIMAVWGNFSSFCSLSITYASEITSEKFGKTVTLVLLLAITAAELAVVFLAYIIPSWRVLFVFCMTIPALCSNLLFKFIDESPVFLYGKGEVNQTIDILKKISKENGTDVDFGVSSAGKSSMKMSVAQAPTPQRSWNYLQIMIHPKLRLRVLIFSVLKFYLNMAFFGSIFALSSLGGSIYTNSTIACVAEGLGYIFALKAYLFKPKSLLKASLQIVVVTGISFLLIPTLSCESSFICSPTFLQGFLALILRMVICFCLGFLFNVGNELFPAEVRCQSIGVSEIAACIGGMVAPFVIVAAEVNHLNPLFLFGSLGFFALSSVKYLPETQIKSLDDNDTGDVEMNYVKMSEKK